MGGNFWMLFSETIALTQLLKVGPKIVCFFSPNGFLKKHLRISSKSRFFFGHDAVPIHQQQGGMS